MRRKLQNILIILSFLIPQLGLSQGNESGNRDYQREIITLQSSIKGLKASNAGLSKRLNRLEQNLDSANDSLAKLGSALRHSNSQIVQQIGQLEKEISQLDNTTDKRISDVDHSLGNTTLVVMVAILLAILLTIIAYLVIEKRRKNDVTSTDKKINQAKSNLEEGLVKQFEKQTELMASALEAIKNQEPAPAEVASVEPDHSLALKVASEINLIERNISLMDPTTKGLKQLARSVEKLKDNLSANGYEMPAMLGKPFHQGMKVIIISSIPDETLEKGAELITKVLIPQVNYNDNMIQTAQIEVSVGI